MKIDDEKFNEIFNEENQKENTNSASDDAVQKIEINNNFVSVNLYDWVNSIIVAVIAVVLLLTFCFRLIDVDGISTTISKVFTTNESSLHSITNS